jgi:hypothetical protein
MALLGEGGSYFDSSVTPDVPFQKAICCHLLTAARQGAARVELIDPALPPALQFPLRRGTCRSEKYESASRYCEQPPLEAASSFISHLGLQKESGQRRLAARPMSAGEAGMESWSANLLALDRLRRWTGA